MCDSEVNENRREEPPDFSMTNLRQAGFPAEISVKKAVASDAEIIHLRLAGGKRVAGRRRKYNCGDDEFRAARETPATGYF